MFVRLRERPNKKISIQIVENIRQGSKTSQKLIRSLGTASRPEDIETMKAFAENLIAELKQRRDPKLDLKFSESKQSQEPRVVVKNLREDKRVVLGPQDILGRLYDKLGFHTLLPVGSPYQEVLKQCVLARIVSPQSKRATAQFLDRQFDIQIPLQKFYRMLDLVAKIEDRVKQLICYNTLGLFQQKVDVLFFDVTTLYFESFTEDDLRAFGFSKDCKFKEVQVVLALVTTHDGQPISYELFPGNTYEGSTLVQMIINLKKNFDVKNVVLVADRAMFNENNLSTLEALEVSYIVAAKLRGLKHQLKHLILASSAFRPVVIEEEMHWIHEFKTHEKRRLVVSYSSNRAKKDADDRRRLVDRLLKKVKKKSAEIPVDQLIGNRGTAKFIKLEGGTATVDEQKILLDAEWDGLHGVITNDSPASASAILSRYRGLWQIEAAFRMNKNDLRMRPIFHWTPNRIKAHIAICYMAYALSKVTLRKLKASGLSVSLAELQVELMNVQASYLTDKSNYKKFLLPSQLNSKQLAIYNAMGVAHTDAVRALS